MDAIGGIGVPTLVLAGSADRLAPLHHAHHLTRTIPGCRSVVLEGVGHHPPLEATDQVAAHILSFLDRLDTSRWIPGPTDDDPTMRVR